MKEMIRVTHKNGEETETELEIPDEESGVTAEWLQQAIHEEELLHQQLTQSLSGEAFEKQIEVHNFRMFCIRNAKDTLKHRREALEAYEKGECVTLEEFNRRMDELDEKEKREKNQNP